MKQQFLSKYYIYLFIIVILNTISKKNYAQILPFDSLKVKLETMSISDQLARERFLEANIQLEKLFGALFKIDSANKIEAIQIIEKYGWIDENLIGKEASESLFLIIQHSDSLTIAKYFPLLREKAIKGRASKIHAATMEDRLLMFQCRKQIYGTQCKSNIDNSIIIWPIEDYKQVNARRNEVGFKESIEEYSIKMNAVLNFEAQLNCK